MPKNGSKNELFEYFWARLLKHCFHICNLHYQICLAEKFPKKTPKGLNFGPKMICFAIFGLEFLTHYCHIWDQQPQICWIGKLHGERKMPKYGIKNSLSWRFGAWILKHYCDILILHTQICRLAKFNEKVEMPKFRTRNALFGFFGLEF